MSQLNETELQFVYWCKRNLDTGCWKWLNEQQSNKPRLKVGNRQVSARRWVIEYAGRNAAPGTRFHHRPGRRTSPCVNPDHWIEHWSTGRFSGPTFYDCLDDLEDHRLRLGEDDTGLHAIWESSAAEEHEAIREAMAFLDA